MGILKNIYISVIIDDKICKGIHIVYFRVNLFYDKWSSYFAITIENGSFTSIIAESKIFWHRTVVRKIRRRTFFKNYYFYFLCWWDHKDERQEIRIFRGGKN